MEDKRRGFALGLRAVGLAVMAESRLNTSDKNLSAKERWKIKNRVLKGGAAALIVSLLSRPKDTKLRQRGLELTDRIL